MNKKASADSWIMIGWFIFLVIIMCIGIVVQVESFFDIGFDTRQIDSATLNAILQNCLTENEINFESSREQITEQIFEKCSLNKEVIENSMLLIINLENENKIKIGRGDETACALVNKNNDYPKCEISKVKLIENKKILTIITGSYQDSQQKIG